MSIFVLKMLIYIMLVTVAEIKEKHPELILSCFLCLFIYICLQAALQNRQIMSCNTAQTYYLEKWLVKLQYLQRVGKIFAANIFWLPHVEPCQDSVDKWLGFPRTLPGGSAAWGSASSAFDAWRSIAENKPWLLSGSYSRDLVFRQVEQQD